MLNTHFVIVGPNVLSGPWREADYHDGLQFIEDMQEAMDLPYRLDAWLVNWCEDDSNDTVTADDDAREALRVHAGIRLP